MISFFAGAGVEYVVLGDLKQQLLQNRDAMKKHELARAVLTRLNEQGDNGMATRRAVLRRVVEWQNFAACYPDNQGRAEEIVRHIAGLVNIKDARTREEEIEISRNKIDYLLQQNEVQKRKFALAEIRESLLSLIHQPNPQQRGKMLENVLNRYFKVSGILVREAFALTSPYGEGIVEQIDGVVEIDGSLHLVEMKWWQEPIGVTEISRHISRIYSRSHACGIFVSASGFTKAAVTLCREALQHKLITLCELQEIMILLEQEKLLKDFFKAKVHAAVIDKKPLWYPLTADINA